MNRILIILLAWSATTTVSAQNVFTVEEVILRAKTQSPAFKVEETKLENRYWAYRSYRTDYNPQMQIQNSGGPIYSNTNSPVVQPDGTIIYRPINQINPGVNFALQQPLQWTGGTIAVNSSYNYFRSYGSSGSEVWNGSPMNVSLFQPLLAYNRLKWDRKIEPILYEESKREYAEQMEKISADAVDFFFSVLDAQVNLQIAKFNLAYNDTIYKIEQGRYNIGTTSEDKLLQVELQLLRSRQDVATANLQLQTTSLKLRTYIGLRNGETFELKMPDHIPVVQVTEEEALEHARATRSTFIAFERKKIQAKAAVAETRGNLYDVNLSANYGLNNVQQTLPDLFNQPSKQQFANVQFNIPVVDWGRRRARMQTARANQRLQDFVIAQSEISFEQEIRTQVRQFELLYLQLEITKKSDEVAYKRYVVAQNRYLIGKVDITNLNIALNEKDAAKRGYISALRQFWTAYYTLRNLTLYDFAERKLLYNPNEDAFKH